MKNVYYSSKLVMNLLIALCTEYGFDDFTRV